MNLASYKWLVMISFRTPRTFVFQVSSGQLGEVEDWDVTELAVIHRISLYVVTYPQDYKQQHKLSKVLRRLRELTAA